MWVAHKGKGGPVSSGQERGVKIFVEIINLWMACKVPIGVVRVDVLV